MARTLALGARRMAQGKHQRVGQRPNIRRYPPDGTEWGQSSWGSPSTPAVPATGATAGIPGTFTPAGSTPPATVAALQGGVPNAVVASPATAWTVGQYVQTATAGAAGEATWTGAGWVGGRSLVTGVLDGTIDEVKAYVNGLPNDDNRDNVIQQLIDHERTHQNRATLVSWLDQQTGVE